MPILHCSNCHHEWEYIGDDWEHDLCDWCGSTPYKIAEKCNLEIMCDHFSTADGYVDYHKLEKFFDEVTKEAEKKKMGDSSQSQ